jgi:hypothetical protein
MHDPIQTAVVVDQVRDAYIQAAESHEKALGREFRSEDARRTSAGDRQRMLDRAAAGENVTEADLRRAGEALKAATDTADLQRSLAEGTQKIKNEREIGLQKAIVADHDARVYTAQVAMLHAAREIDEAVSAASMKVMAYSDCLGTLRQLQQEAGHHNNHTLPDVIAHNKVLAGLHGSQQPKMREVPSGNPNLAVLLIHKGQDGGLGDGVAVVHSLEAQAAGLAPKVAIEMAADSVRSIAAE